MSTLITKQLLNPLINVHLDHQTAAESADLPDLLVQWYVEPFQEVQTRPKLEFLFYVFYV